MKRYFSGFRAEIGYVVSAFGLGFALSFSAVNAPENLGEYGLFELLQVLVLGASTVLWLVRGPAAVSLNVLMASVMLLFLGREASWMRVYGASEAIVDTLKLIHLGILLATLSVLTIIWLRRPAREARIFRTAFLSQYKTWILLGISLILVGDVFEKQIFDLTSNLFWEEWTELIAYACFLVPPLFFTPQTSD